MQNKNRLYNVPMITRVVDNRGNELNPPIEGREHIAFIVRDNGNGDLKIGETLSVEIEVDQTFPEDSYEVAWRTTAGDAGLGRHFSFEVGLAHVGDDFTVSCTVIAKQKWHRTSMGWDDHLIMLYRVLPP